MNNLLHIPNENLVGGASAIREGMAFVSENLDAFGFVSDAYPVATERWLIAANGREADAGAATFTYPSAGGVLGLYATLFSGLTDTDATTDEVLSHTFGVGVERREHPVARYAAALAECVALHVLRSTAENETHEAIAARLGMEIPSAMSGLRENICRDGLTARHAELYAASLAVCRMTELGGGNYVLDWFVAGDYRAFLLDSNGLRPLHLPHTEMLTPESENSPLGGKRITLSHPSPFAVLLLSGSACDINAVEWQSLKENRGLEWRYRMRLEAYILRILTSCARENEFGERAGRFFMGRANGRESSSGAMAIFRGDTPFASFRADCLARLRHLEDIIALLPDGYDPGTLPRLPSRTETEHAYIRRLLSQEHGLAERTFDALCGLALHRLHGKNEEAEESCPLPEDVPDYRRLLTADVAEVFRLYDSENDEDYACIRHNSAALREYMSEHWVTLRPILLSLLHANAAEAATEDEILAVGSTGKEGSDTDAPCGDAASASIVSTEDEELLAALSPRDRHRILCDRAYRSILRINGRLGELLEKRQACMTRVADELSDQALILRVSGGDWLHGRTGGDQPAEWADQAEAKLADALRSFAGIYEETEAEYHALLSAYMTERDLLFARDAEWADGAFAEEWTSMLNGRLPEERWEAYRVAIAASTVDEGTSYETLWKDLHIISRGTGARYAQIRGRAADTRMARDIAGRTEMRIAAIRASAYEDRDWGEHICALLDAAHRNSYLLMVRRWQESCEMAAHRAAAFEEYRVMYEEYAGE